jgi:hypothetical protein
VRVAKALASLRGWVRLAPTSAGGFQLGFEVGRPEAWAAAARSTELAKDFRFRTLAGTTEWYLPAVGQVRFITRLKSRTMRAKRKIVRELADRSFES